MCGGIEEGDGEVEEGVLIFFLDKCRVVKGHFDNKPPDNSLFLPMH